MKKKQFSELCLYGEARSTKQPQSISLFDTAGRDWARFKDRFRWRWVVKEWRRGSKINHEG